MPQEPIHEEMLRQKAEVQAERYMVAALRSAVNSGCEIHQRGEYILAFVQACGQEYHTASIVQELRHLVAAVEHVASTIRREV